MRRGFGAAPPIVGVLGSHRGLIALTILAASLRFPTLDVQSFWHDEAVTAARLIRPGLLDTLRVIPDSEATPPLYYMLAWAWSKLFGTGEVGLRSLSALAGVATVPVTYRAAADLVSRRGGLVAAALVATNPMLVWFSQEARSYSLVVLLTALSFLFFTRALERSASGSLAGWAVSSMLALATHYFALFVVAPEAIWLLIRATHRRRATAAVGATAAAGLVVLPLAIYQARDGKGSWIGELPLGERVLGAIRTFLTGQADQIELLAAAAAVLVVAGLALLAVRTNRVERRGGLLGLSIGVVALALPLGLSAAGADYFLDKNLVPALVPLTVAVSAGLGAGRAGWVGLLPATALCGLFTLISLLTATREDLQRADWRGVAAALGEARERRVIVAPQNADQPLGIYLPGARQARDATTRTREVIVLGWVEPGALAAPLPPTFNRTRPTGIAGFETATFRASQPVELNLRDLSATEVGAAAQGPAAILIQDPESQAG